MMAMSSRKTRHAMNRPKKSTPRLLSRRRSGRSLRKVVKRKVLLGKPGARPRRSSKSSSEEPNARARMGAQDSSRGLSSYRWILRFNDWCQKVGGVEKVVGFDKWCVSRSSSTMLSDPLGFSSLGLHESEFDWSAKMCGL